MGENPYAPPQSRMTSEREYQRVVRKRAAVAAAIDGGVTALIFNAVDLVFFGLAFPSGGALDRRWLAGVALLLVYNLVCTVTGTSLGGLLTRTRESKHNSIGWLVFVTLFRTLWPLPFAIGGTIGALYAATLIWAPENGLRPDVSGILFMVGPWVVPFFAWLFVRLRRETWQIADTVLLTPPAV